MDRILIIDDDVALCELVTEYLEPLGFAVEAVHQGHAGAERAVTGEHSLVVLDVMLPRPGRVRSVAPDSRSIRNPRIDADRARRRRGPHRGPGDWR